MTVLGNVRQARMRLKSLNTSEHANAAAIEDLFAEAQQIIGDNAYASADAANVGLASGLFGQAAAVFTENAERMRFVDHQPRTHFALDLRDFAQRGVEIDEAALRAAAGSMSPTTMTPIRSGR